jgi:anthranilate synthase
VPMHGKPSVIRASGNRLFGGLPSEFTVGRYHSLYARRAALPSELSIAAETTDGVIMAIEHKTLSIAAVQFHPESIMTPPNGVGLPIIAAMLSTLCAEPIA